MAWTETGVGHNDAYGVYSEAVTTTEGTAVFSSVVDFIPKGKDFQVICNSAATNTSVSTHVELWVGYAKGGTYYRQNHSGFNATSALIDTATTINFVDVSAVGEFPFYKFKFPSAGGSVTMKVIPAG